MFCVNKWVAYFVCWAFICIGVALCCYGVGAFVIETRVQEPVVRDWSTDPENGVSGVEIDTDDNPSYPETGNGDATGTDSDADDTLSSKDSEDSGEVVDDGSSEQEVIDDGEE